MPVVIFLTFNFSAFVKRENMSKTKNCKWYSVGLCDFRGKKTELDYSSYAK